ncbi:MAG TPA: hypothetical protein VH917_03840, partial [Ignavibacteriaceae bacterium]
MRKIFYWRYRLVIYLLIIALFNFLLIQFPLTNVFGFEFAALNALLLSLLAGLQTIPVLYGINKEDKKQRMQLIRINLLSLLAVPFLISIINSF